MYTRFLRKIVLWKRAWSGHCTGDGGAPPPEGGHCY